MSSLNLGDAQASCVAIGRRKTSVAKVQLIPGKGTILVNNKPGELYFQYNLQYMAALKAPLLSLGLENNYDIRISTHGGGLKGQTDAAKLGVARALCYISKESKVPLKRDGFLVRDSRSKERKKYGLRKARKAPQFSKR